eukprot:scaffold84_cov163-Amphora_coffeaeformis.AAC.11
MRRCRKKLYVALRRWIYGSSSTKRSRGKLLCAMMTAKLVASPSKTVDSWRQNEPARARKKRN